MTVEAEARPKQRAACRGRAETETGKQLPRGKAAALRTTSLNERVSLLTTEERVLVTDKAG